ncbi:unnamed protein product [Symbiodinium sp. KB8]|nr:unnamed protein product [Symbiodinium sp. KB8]
MNSTEHEGHGAWSRVPTWDGSPATWRTFKREMQWWTSSLDLEATKKYNLAARWLMRHSGVVRQRGEEFSPEDLVYKPAESYVDPDTGETLVGEPEDILFGLNKLLDALEKMSGQTPLDRRGELRTVFYTNLSRRAGERVADFASRFRTTAADLKAEGVRLPDSELGWFLKEKLGLDALRKQMLETALAGREAYGDVESESLRLFRDLHLPDPLFKRLGSEAKGGGKLTVRRIFGVGRPPSSSATSTSGARTSEGSRRSSWSSLPASSFSRRTSVGSTRQVQVAEADEAEDQETEHEAETAAEEPKGERSFEEVLQAEVEQLAEEIAEAEEAGVDAETLEALECGPRIPRPDLRDLYLYGWTTQAQGRVFFDSGEKGDPECPKPGAGLGRKQPGKTKQAESYEANPPHDVMMISHAGLDLEQALRALDNAREALAMGIGYAVDKALVGALDSACNRTCAGEDWLRDYVEHVRAFAPDWVKAMMKTEPETENFRFGNGGTLPSRLRHKVPAVICDRVVFLWISTVPVNSLGLLIGRDALDCLQAVLDFSRRTLKCEVFGDNVPVTPLEKLTAGHLALPLAPERWPEKLPKARWHRMGLDGVLEMQLSCRLWTRHLLQRETVTAQGEHNHYMTEASACLAKLAYQFRHRGCDGSFQMPGKINLVRLFQRPQFGNAVPPTGPTTINPIDPCTRGVFLWRRFALRLIGRREWHYEGLRLWLVKRPSLRWLPVPYPAVSTVGEAMMNGGILPRRWGDRMFFAPASLVSLTWFRSRAGLEFCFLEDPMVSGMLAARFQKGRFTAMKNQAARAEAAEVAKNQDRLKAARQLIGPRGGLPVLKADLIKLATLLHIEVSDQDKVVDIRSKIRPLIVDLCASVPLDKTEQIPSGTHQTSLTTSSGAFVQNRNNFGNDTEQTLGPMSSGPSSSQVPESVTQSQPVWEANAMDLINRQMAAMDDRYQAMFNQLLTHVMQAQSVQPQAFDISAGDAPMEELSEDFQVVGPQPSHATLDPRTQMSGCLDLR